MKDISEVSSFVKKCGMLKKIKDQISSTFNDKMIYMKVKGQVKEMSLDAGSTQNVLDTVPGG